VPRSSFASSRIRGTVRNYPEIVLPFREVVTPTGTHRFFWIEFESLQTDAEGGGPYGSAEVNEKYLEAATD
jgi:hypothetical protein